MPHDPFYSSSEWRTARAEYIRDHPTCEEMGCAKPTKHVDHKLSRRRGGASLDPNNFMGLCHSHHSAKTAGRDGGFGNPESLKGCDAGGWPTDPRHPWNSQTHGEPCARRMQTGRPMQSEHCAGRMAAQGGPRRVHRWVGGREVGGFQPLAVMCR